jgi:hypothetical protein
MENNNDILEYKNFYLFYSNLYQRLFNVITLLIDEREYSIVRIKNSVIDFLDWYSYYLLKQKLITKQDSVRTTMKLLEEIEGFNSFYEPLLSYPSNSYTIKRIELTKHNYNISKLTSENQEYIMKEYYFFFEEALQVMRKFIEVTSECGFLPNIKSKTALKSIGYANYDLFFTNLENLKIKSSEITNSVNISNSFISRRCMYCILITFSPYFRNQEVLDTLIKRLSFKFLDDPSIMRNLKKVNSYSDVTALEITLKKELDRDLLIPLKNNISLIKRYISFEFGERDMSPTIKKKYAYDPTGT